MKKIIFILILVFIISCKKESNSITKDVVNEAKETTEVVAQEGTGKVTLTCNGKEFTTEGICGALVSMGQFMIAVKDKINPTKVFVVNFNTEDFPEIGKIYTIKEQDYRVEGKGPKDQISVSFMEGLPNNKMNSWGSEDAKGTLQFTQNGTATKCSFKNIQLSANTMFNPEDLDQNGIVSGELTFYKN